MVDWEITATTIFCDDVDDEVTLLIYADGTVKCTGREKRPGKNKGASTTGKKTAGQTGKERACPAGECELAAEQARKHLGQESKKV